MRTSAMNMRVGGGDGIVTKGSARLAVGVRAPGRVRARRSDAGSISLESLLFIVLAGALIVPYVISFRAPATGTYHDDAIYLVTAKSLAEGTGYRIISLPADIAQTKYPPLFPFALSLIWRWNPAFPQNVGWLKGVPLICGAVWLVVSYLFIRGEIGSTRAARWIVLLTAACPAVVFVSTILLSETMFALLCMTALLAIRRLEQGESSIWLVFACALLAAGSFLTRTIGVSLVVAAVIALFMQRRFKPAAAIVVIFSLLVTPWLVWQSRNPAPADFSYYTKASYDAGNLLLHFTLHQKAVILAKNALFAFATTGVLYGLGWSVFGFLLAFLFTGIAVVGFLRDAISRVRSLHIFVLCYIAIVFLWAGVSLRFFVPLLPLILLFAYKAISAMDGWFHMRGRAVTVAVVAFVLIAGHALVWQSRMIMRYEAAGVPYEPPPDWHITHQLLDWVRANTAPDDVILRNIDPMMYLYTGRKTVRGFLAVPYELFYARQPKWPLGPPSGLVNEIVRWHVKYLVSEPDSAFEEGPYFRQLLDAVRAQYPAAFEVVWSGADPRYRVYRVDYTKLPNATGRSDPGS